MQCWRLWCATGPFGVNFVKLVKLEVRIPGYPLQKPIRSGNSHKSHWGTESFIRPRTFQAFPIVVVIVVVVIVIIIIAIHGFISNMSFSAITESASLISLTAPGLDPKGCLLWERRRYQTLISRHVKMDYFSPSESNHNIFI